MKKLVLLTLLFLNISYAYAQESDPVIIVEKIDKDTIKTTTSIAKILKCDDVKRSIENVNRTISLVAENQQKENAALQKQLDNLTAQSNICK